jgi:ATP phosphoribosyltransferase regulatory subunit
MGAIGDYELFEVVSLALKSLQQLSSRAILNLSHFGLLSRLIDSFGVSAGEKREILKAVGEKNRYELESILSACGVAEEKISVLSQLIGIYGEPDHVLPQVRTLLQGSFEEELSLLTRICHRLKSIGGDVAVSIDFSVVNDFNYYNGIVFKGFVQGIPTWVLSGGQYDRLMQKMNRDASAIGFAVYLDQLSEFSSVEKEYDADVLLLFDETDSIESVDATMERFRGEGKTVMAQKTVPEKWKAKEWYRVTESGVVPVERNA